MNGARGALLLAVGVWLLASACSLAVATEELGQGCAPGTKPCEVTPGDQRCVSTSDPLYGCARESCVPCTLSHADEVCDRDGECAIGACVSDYENCDLQSRTGCEVDLSTSYDDCGRCGASCADALRAMPHTAQNECLGKRCVVVSCREGYADCDSAPSNGCETRVSALAPERCGRCNGCPEGTACNEAAQRCEE